MSFRSLFHQCALMRVWMHCMVEECLCRWLSIEAPVNHLNSSEWEPWGAYCGGQRGETFASDVCKVLFVVIGSFVSNANTDRSFWANMKNLRQRQVWSVLFTQNKAQWLPFVSVESSSLDIHLFAVNVWHLFVSKADRTVCSPVVVRNAYFTLWFAK